MVDRLKRLLDDLKSLRKDLKAEKVTQVSKKDLRNRAEAIGSRWFSEFAEAATHELGLSTDTLQNYTDGFGRLISLSSPNNLKKSYIEALDSIIKPFRGDLILPVQKGGNGTASLVLLHNILNDLPDQEENEYLREAVSCAQRGFFRASVVLGWCACIDRIHHRIEAVGFTQFNVTSVKMAGQKKGRFKKFNKVQNVSSIGELREVFDSVVLWIVEGMGMIDSNEHTRLRSCFEMRCHCGHPGEAPITEYNLMSFFSDLKEIVLGNDKFAV